jgi:hypothetical protein
MIEGGEEEPFAAIALDGAGVHPICENMLEYSVEVLIE